jgi:hypothetical protein
LRSADGSTYTTIDDPNGVITLAYRINDAGQVVGYYQDSSGPGHNHGFIATPLALVPEPSTLVLAVLGGLVLLGYGGWRRWASTA